MFRSSRWLLSGILVFVSLSGLFAQVATFQFHADTTYRELNPVTTDGCTGTPYCHYHPGMETWGNDTPMKEYCYTGKDINGNVIEFMNWRMLFPVGFNQNNLIKYPLIIMLHGSGESGRLGCCGTNWAPNNVKYDNNDMQVMHGGKEHQIATGYSYTTGLPSGPVNWPGLVIWPQSSYNGSWEGGWDNGILADDGRMAVQIVDYIIKTAKFNVDPDRISIHGLSNGAQGAWDVAAKRSDLFAAFLPMSGVATNYDAQTDSLVTMPIWQFQGGLDTNPNPQASLDLYNMLVAKGGNPKYTLYPTLGHGTWQTAYAEPDFFPFMLRANKKNIYVFGGDPSICTGGLGLKLGFSAGYAHLQWTLNGIDIPAANSRYYAATVPGDYAVRFTRVTDGSIGTSFTTTVVLKSGGSSSYSPPLSHTGSPVLPISVGGTPITGVNNEVKLTAPLGFSTYYWVKNGVTTPSSLNTNIVSGGTGASTDAGTYTVKVLQASGCTSADSNPITLTWTNPQPTLPQPAQPVPVPASATTMNVTWGDVAGETAFEVWRFRYGFNPPPYNYTEQPWTYLTTLPANTTSFTDTGLRPGGWYEYKVRALQGTGGGTFSLDSNWGIDSTDTKPPTAPTNLVVSNVKDTQVTLTWDPSIDNDQVYQYEVYNGSSLLATITGTMDGNPLPATTATLTPLTANTSYLLSVRAIDFSGNHSTFSDGVSVTTLNNVAGVTYKYYEFNGTLTNLASFNFTQPPKTTGTTSTFNIAAGPPRTNQFVFSFEGLIQIDFTGTYTFYTSSDDGSMLYINNDNTGYKTIVSNDGQHGATEVSATCTFTSTGKFPIKVTYFQQSSSKSLTVSYAKAAPNQISKTAIPGSKLSYYTSTPPPFAATYYLRTTGGSNPELASSWTPNQNGTGGTSPNSSVFTTSLQQFIITNNANVALGSSATWTVSGSGSKVVVATGTTLTLSGVLAGTVDAQSGATIVASNSSLPQFGNLDPASNVNFSLGGSTTIPNDTYGNVSLLSPSSNTYAFPLSATIINGNLSVSNGVTSVGSTNNQSIISVGGNINFSNNPNVGIPNQYALKFTGGKKHMVTISSPTDLNLFSMVADFGDTIQFGNGIGHTLTLGSSSGGGLIMRTGASLNLLNGNISVTGNGTINPNNETGVLAMNGGTFSFRTGATQNSSVYFSNVANQYQVDNFTSLTPSNTRISVLSPVNIRSLVTLLGGELNSNGGSITLLSDAIGTARIGPITGTGAKITGSIAAKRYMSMDAPGKVFRYISSPVKGLSVGALQNYITINGNFTGSSTGGPPGTIPSMYSYTEPNYVYFPASGGTNQDTLVRGKGYAVYIYEPNNPTTWVATGTPYQGTIPFNLTPGTNNPSDGWNLLGNPYPSPIQWTGSGTTSAGWPVMTNINPTVYVRHNFGTQYKWYFYRQGLISPGGDLEILANGIIASGQAFWVMAASSPAMSIAEPAKYTPDGGTYYRTNSPARTDDAPDVLAIRLYNSTLDDVAYIMHDDQGTENYEKRQDAVKQLNSFFSLSTRSKDGISLAINVTPHTFCQKDIKLNIDNAAVGNYTLGFFGLETFKRPVTAVLLDNFTGTTKELQAGSTYDFAITTDAASTGAGRFVLTEKPIVLTNTALKTNGVCESNPSITLLTIQSGVQYQALFNGVVVSDTITSGGTDSLKLTLDRKALGYGTHTVSLIAGFPGCDLSTLDQTINVSVDTLQTPSIAYQSGGFLVANPANAEHYQWLLDGSPLNGKTDQILKDNNGAGNYQVKVSTGACSKVSMPFDVTALEDVSSLVKVYPNPFHDQIVVTLPVKIQGGTATLINPIGQKVQSVTVAPQDSYNVTLNFASVEAGAYVLSVGGYKFKVIKIN